jgi:L-alanine-DL-glutamate epimerase-like enolase superfamily enzyme
MKVGQKRLRDDISRVQAVREWVGPEIYLMVDATMRWDVATGENFYTLYEFRHMIEYGRIAYPEPDVSNIGGITNWMRVAKLAYANNLQVTSHGVHELHLHLLAAIPNASFLEVHSFGLERFITNPPEIQDGQMTAADGSGHGVLFDWAALEPYFVDNGKGTR